MAGKKSFEDALIRRGQGVRLTTATRDEDQTSADQQDRETAESQNHESAKTLEHNNAESQKRENMIWQNSAEAETQKHESAESLERPKGRQVKLIRGRDGIERINRGITLRPDLLQDIQLLAVQDHCYDYQLIEEALEEYLQKRKQERNR